MDGKPVDVSNFLILLAPEPLDIARQEVISMISSSLVEDQESLLVFASANDKLIRKKLADIFYRLLREKLIKE
jgi:mannitol operon transcriptional antiterminator